MLPLIDDEPASGDTKPAAKQRYHAIRKCDSLKAPSIFLHWDDCSFYVDEEENDVQVEYQSFDLISEAVKYIQRSDEASEATKLPATTTPKQHHSETLGSSKSGTKDRAARVAPVARASSLLSPTKRSAEEALLSSPGGKKRKVSSSSTTKPAPVAFMSKANGERVPLYAEADVVDLLDDGGDDSFGGGDDDDDDFNFESSTTKPAPASSRAYSRESGILQEKFDTKFELLKEYKQVHGTCNVSFKTGVGKFQGLCNFVQFWKLRLKALEQEPNHPELVDDPNILRLTELGLEAPGTGRKAQWEQSFNLLAEYKELHGTCVVPTNLDPFNKFHSLHRWIYFQHIEMRNYEEDPATSKFDESRYTRLVNLGLAVKGRMQENFDKKFELLKEYKKVYGTCNVAFKRSVGRFHGLHHFVQSWRLKLKALEQEPNNPELVDDPNILRLTILGLEAPCAGRKAIWEQSFTLLAEYKEIHGTCVVPTNLEPSSKFNSIHRWIYLQRTEMRSYEEDPATSKLDESRYMRLANLGLEKGNERKAAKFNVTLPWEDMFEELKKFAKDNGHVKVPKRPITVLQNWVQLMHTHYDRMKQGKKSQLTVQRIAQMVALGFAFDVKVDRMVFDDRALQWLEYKTKHGCDPTTTSGDGLGEWIRRMQRTYLKHTKGENTLLSQKRIDKLNSWGFNWDISARHYTLPTEKINWEDRFQQVLRYKNQNGHCYIPQNHPELGTWVRGQRRAYNCMKAGKKAFVSKEKLARLEAIRFVFNPKNEGTRRLKDAGDHNDSGDDSSSDEEEGHDAELAHHAAGRRGDHATFAPWDRYTLQM